MWLHKDLFDRTDAYVEHVPGDDYNMNDLGYDTYFQGITWLGEKSEVEEAMIHDMVKDINNIVSISLFIGIYSLADEIPRCPCARAYSPSWI